MRNFVKLFCCIQNNYKLKNMKKTYLLLSVIFLTTSVSQIALAQKVNYTIDHNDPNDVRPLKAYLQFLSMEGLALGAGAGAAFSPFKQLLLDGQFRMTYWDVLGVGNSPDDFASEQKKSFKPYFEGGGNLFLMSKVKEGKGKAKITLQSSAYSEKFIKVRCDKRRMRGVRGGVMYYNNIYNFKDGGTVFKSADDNLIKPPSGKYFSVATNSFSTYVGICTRKTKKIQVTPTGYGSRRWFSDSYLFADFLFGATTISDIEYNGQIIDTKGTTKSNTGFRFGAQVDQQGVVTRMEGGLRPGVGMGQPYFLFTFAFTVYGGEKRKTS
jgi:hypothetical protein